MSVQPANKGASMPGQPEEVERTYILGEPRERVTRQIVERALWCEITIACPDVMADTLNHAVNVSGVINPKNMQRLRKVLDLRFPGEPVPNYEVGFLLPVLHNPNEQRVNGVRIPQRHSFANGDLTNVRLTIEIVVIRAAVVELIKLVAEDDSLGMAIMDAAGVPPPPIMPPMGEPRFQDYRYRNSGTFMPMDRWCDPRQFGGPAGYQPQFHEHRPPQYFSAQYFTVSTLLDAMEQLTGRDYIDSKLSKYAGVKKPTQFNNDPPGAE